MSEIYVVQTRPGLTENRYGVLALAMPIRQIQFGKPLVQCEPALQENSQRSNVVRQPIVEVHVLQM